MNPLIITDIVKSSFVSAHATQYKLSILIGMDSLSYCIGSPSQELLVLKKNDFEGKATDPTIALSDQIASFFEQEAFLKLPFKAILLIWTAPHFTLIPNRLYREADKQQYLLPLRDSSDTAEKYLANPIPSIDAQLIYTLPEDLYQLFQQQFKDQTFTLQHAFVSLIEAFSRQAGKGKEVYLNVRDYWVQLFFFDNKELIFANQFQFESEKDFLYYILLTYDQFKLDPKEIPLKIAGMLSEDSVIYQHLYRYILPISFVPLPAIFRTDLDLKEYPAHFFFDLLHLV